MSRGRSSFCATGATAPGSAASVTTGQATGQVPSVMRRRETLVERARGLHGPDQPETFHLSVSQARSDS
ncbi:hypothetical protein ETD86_28710 [Nonomuraea turkmeniaca]|uniref:Uncharacterized protein n=1 Tax=Nonomuraea turkmeniaca TaxID=103838 RepID=A0A5S4FAQ7_9ACTN|nr:hypothetical protein [Nonomuraea turkmeniaca]TMR14402.1 hypothetical protein ETD86_28710 [Nonomuraea turkmeniaca]